MPFNEQLVKTLRAVRDSLDSDGVSSTTTDRALQSACNVVRDSMIAAYADRVSCRSAEVFCHIARYEGVPGIDPPVGKSSGWDSIPADLPTVSDSGRAVRSARKHAERNGMVPDPNAYP